MLNFTRQWPYVQWFHGGMGERAVGWTAVAIAVVCGSTFTPFAKSLSGALSPLSLLFVSEALTLSFVTFSFGLLPMVRSVATANRRTILALLAVGVMSGVGGPLLWFIGLHYTTAVNAVFFGKTEIVFLLFIASRYLHERVTWAHVLVSSVAIIGAVTIGLKGFTDGLLPSIGDMAIVGSAFAYSLGGCVFRKHLSHLAPQIAVLTRSLVAIGAFFIVAPFVERPFIDEVRAFPLHLIPILLGFAFISRFLNTFMFYEAAERLELSRIYPAFMLDVIGTTTIAVIVLGETLQWYHVLGGTLILASNVGLQRLGVRNDDEQLEHHVVDRVAHRAA